jgi:lipoate-protein ligase A
MSVEVEIGSPSSPPEDPYERAMWRVIVQPPGNGAWNMAVDEAILETVAGGQSPPTLRFYGWEPPCLSLGQAQQVAEVDLARLGEHGWGLVRRITGGWAILHTDELTYSVVVPGADRRVAGGVVESYRRLSMGLLAGLEQLGTGIASHTGSTEGAPTTQGPVCFEVPSHYEITARGKKLLGSAQTRRRGMVLQHGTLPLTGDLGRICDALVFEGEAAREAAKERVLARAATLQEALGHPVTFEQAAEAIMAGLASALNLELIDGQLTPTETARAEELLDAKYATDEWTLYR